MPKDSPLLFVISGPSGSGKGTLLDHIAETQPDLVRVQTYTTRPARPNETKDDYNFVSEPAFQRLVDQGELYEHTRTYEDYCYGSPKILVEDADPRDLIVELEVKGMLRMKAASKRRVVGIFILPSSVESLKERIMARHLEENFDARIKKAIDQVSYAYAYDYLLVNDVREIFLQEAFNVVAAERARRRGDSFMRNKMSEFMHT